MRVPIFTEPITVSFENLSYHDNGIAHHLKQAVEAWITQSLGQSLGDALISVKFKTLIDANTSLLQISNMGGFSVQLHPLQVDLKKGHLLELEGFEIDTTPQVAANNNPFFVNRCIDRQVRKEMATRRRFSAFISSAFIPIQNKDAIQASAAQCDCRPSLIHTMPNGRQFQGLLPWRCYSCEKKYLCTCNKGVLEHYATRERFNTTDAEALLKQVAYKDGICHLCRKVPSSTRYRAPMYGGSDIYNFYYPYIYQRILQKNIDKKEAENEVREILEVPRIGEGWVSETLLANLVKFLFPDYLVEREASPEWLERQRFDIYLPEIKLAIEYQGQQHYQPIAIFGGEEGFKKNVFRDQLKRDRAKAAGVEIIEFRHGEQLTEDLVSSRIKPVIERLKALQK